MVDRIEYFTRTGTRVIEAKGKLIIGDKSYINGGGHIRVVGADIVLENEVAVADNVFMTTSYGNHYAHPHNLERIKPILIKSGAWVGYGAMIRGGVTIGICAVIAMGAVVLDDVENFAVVSGNPAAKIGFRPDLDEKMKEAKEKGWT